MISARSALLPTVLAAATAVATLVTGCGPDSLSEPEQQKTYDIYRSGLEMQADQFVRAETLRAAELTETPAIADEAAELLDDPAPVVRVAAMRTLLRAGDPDSPYRALLTVFDDDAPQRERHQVLDIALDEEGERLRETALRLARRDVSPRIRMLGLQKGVIDELQQLQEDDEDRDVDEYDLLDELAEFVDDDDPRIAATALRELIANDRTSRVDRLLETFGDQTNATDQRVAAGQVLMLARVDEARPHYEDILEEADEERPEGLRLPEPPMDDDLIRIAVLGKAILGDVDYVEGAQEYRVEAETTEEALEVIEALGHNPSEEAAISLRSDIRSSNPDIRRRAMTIYADRDDARADVFIGALDHEDVETRRRAISVVADTFRDEFAEQIRRDLASPMPDDVEESLWSLHRILRADPDAQPAVEQLRDSLEQLVTEQKLDLDFDEDDGEDPTDQIQQINTLAAWLLFQISDETDRYQQIIDDHAGPRILSSYLEHLAVDEPAEHADVLRDYLLDDLYVMRLMAATGLWRAFGDGDDVRWPGAPDPEAEEQDEE